MATPTKRQIKELSDQIRDTLGIRTRRKVRQGFILDQAYRYAARYQELPHSVETATYGIKWAVETLRVGYPVVKGMEALTVKQFCDFIAEVSLACETIGHVPGYLNQRFAPEEVA